MTATMVSAPPRFRAVPLHVSSAGQDCIDLAEGAGLILDDWQREVIRDALAVDPSGGWAAMEVALIVPRQNGKGGILEALELYHLFLVRSTHLITHTAHRFDTCLDHFRRVRKLIEDTPELLALVKDNGRGIGGVPSGIKDSNGKESIELRNGDRLNFKAREKGSGRGFSGDLVVLDEAYYLKDLSGLIPTMAARENPQAWYTSSAPLPDVVSDQLRSLIRQGRALALDPDAGRPEPDDPTLAYIEWSVDAPAGKPLAVLLDELLEDDDKIAEGNPAYGIRINRRFCKLERRRLGDQAFARERFGIFPDDDDAPRWEIVAEAQWAGCATSETPDWLNVPGWVTEPAYAIEMDPDRSMVAVGVAGKCREGGIGLDVAVYQAAGTWLVGWLQEHGIAEVVIDRKSPAWSLSDELTKAGVKVIEATFDDVKKATGDGYDAIVNREVRHRRRPELDLAVARGRKRSVGDTWLIDRHGPVDASPFNAVLLARHQCLRPVKKARSGVVW